MRRSASGRTTSRSTWARVSPVASAACDEARPHDRKAGADVLREISADEQDEADDRGREGARAVAEQSRAARNSR